RVPGSNGLGSLRPARPLAARGVCRFTARRGWVVCSIPRRWWGRPRSSGGLAQVNAGFSPLARGALGGGLAWSTLTPASAPRTPGAGTGQPRPAQPRTAVGLIARQAPAPIPRGTTTPLGHAPSPRLRPAGMTLAFRLLSIYRRDV